jgi:integrase
MVTLPAKGVRSLCFRGDDLVDWVAGGHVYCCDGTERDPHVYHPYRFDCATSSPDGRYVVLYERLGTKAILLDDGRLVRELTGMRQGELRALLPADVDFDAMQIAVTKQARQARGEAKNRTKTGRARYVAIEPNLVPLLRWLVAHPLGKRGRLLHVPPAEDCAELLRKDLRTAECEREALFADDAQREPITFHKLRHTCGVHMAVRRDPPYDVQWRMGHTNAAMTERYIAEARQAAGANFGQPLAPLPACLPGVYGNTAAIDAASTLN